VLAVALVSLLASACATTGGAVSAKTGRLETHVEPDQAILTHTVLKGQTLYRIARTYELSVEELMDANRIDDPRELKVGEVLYLPGVKQRRSVTEYDSPEPEPPSRPATTKPEATKKRAPPPKAVRVGKGSGVLQWPLRGVLYARFGKKGKEPHDGIDLSAPAGLPVKVAAPGLVLFAGDQKGYGLIVIVEHANGLITLYAHNRDLRVKTGQKVREGQVVATVGDSGRTSGPHLHFEVRKDGVPVDPLEYLGPVPPP
jgi:murein DD-endopeptidase MepM/ murein hydrolase activator NlpD